LGTQKQDTRQTVRTERRPCASHDLGPSERAVRAGRPKEDHADQLLPLLKAIWLAVLLPTQGAGSCSTTLSPAKQLRTGGPSAVRRASTGGKAHTDTNCSGGTQGGISNGETIYFRVAFKPVATVMHEQDTVDSSGKNTTLKGRGRHDPCVLPRAVPMVEAMAALVLIDHALRQQAQCGGPVQ
jgi:Chorismate synthase